ncbi:hypothetical protein [Pseudooceanicola algae]|uniref:Invasion associated locus B (IalB) protein n=1 Tax=Pseudooceanicola algae TaxID=1537215 RepID=A0A418SIN8_9RHOB|nr:hypothetical protein [Pseudooceanicola algae]QPM91158.1 hypothetical protein PSAL_024070 [Pseudooceanicola algae]
MRLFQTSLPAARKLAPKWAPYLAVALSLAAPLPALAQSVVENDQAKVFNERWMQSKAPDKAGLLMYLTPERAVAGEYFSIRCEEGGGRSVRVSFAEKLPSTDGKVPRSDKPYASQMLVAVDGNQGGYALEYTGPVEDPQIHKGTFHSYRVQFPSPQAMTDFLTALQRGQELTILGQSLPVDLTGAGKAITEQAAYCG